MSRHGGRKRTVTSAGIVLNSVVLAPFAQRDGAPSVASTGQGCSRAHGAGADRSARNDDP